MNKEKIQYEIYYKQNRMQQLKAFIMVVKYDTMHKAAEVMGVGVSSVLNKANVDMFYKNTTKETLRQ